MHRTLRWLLDDAYDAWLRVDARGRVIDWPEKATAFFGRDAVAALGSEAVTSLGVERLPAPPAEGAAARVSGETPYRRPDGRTGDVEITCVPQAQGEQLLLVREISERRAAELRLEAGLRELGFYRRALDEVAMVSIADAEGRILHANDRLVAASGYPRDELLGRDHRIINSGLHPPEFFRDLWQTITRGRPWSGEIRERRRNGTTFWVDCVIVPSPGAGGRPERSMAFRFDASARKEAEQRLRQSEQELLETQRIARMGRWELSLADGRSHWSPEAVNLIGITPTGRPRHDLRRLFALVHPEDRGSLRFQLRRALRGLADINIDCRLLPPGAAGPRHLHVTGIAKRNGDNKVIRLVGALLDISERKGVEAALERAANDQWLLNQKLKETQDQLLQSEKMASIGQLAAGVAHEINNPVGYVSSNLSTLGRYVADLLTLLDAYGALEKALGADHPQVAEIAALKQRIEIDYVRQDLLDLLRESQEGVARVRRIVQDLKDFSHVDEGEWQPEDLARGIESTLNIVHNELKYKAEVIKEIAELPPVECLGSQLNQVFMNLLVNAAHAIKERGTIRIRAGLAEPGAVFVEISDTGCGIPKENLARIFDPFFTTKPVGQGTGLGLSLAYSIVSRHAGRIEVESEPGRGTTFRVVIPIKRPQEPAGGEAVAR